jgi:hypothetical protein
MLDRDSREAETAEKAGEHSVNLADMEEIEEARRVLLNMGLRTVDRMTVGAGIGLVMSALMTRHGRFVDMFGAELADRGVDAATINEAAKAASMAMIRESWGEGGR